MLGAQKTGSRGGCWDQKCPKSGHFWQNRAEVSESLVSRGLSGPSEARFPVSGVLGDPSQAIPDPSQTPPRPPLQTPDPGSSGPLGPQIRGPRRPSGPRSGPIGYPWIYPITPWNTSARPGSPTSETSSSPRESAGLVVRRAFSAPLCRHRALWPILPR